VFSSVLGWFWTPKYHGAGDWGSDNEWYGDKPELNGAELVWNWPV